NTISSNVIAGNFGPGIVLNNVSGDHVVGNLIGTNALGANLGNAGDGLLLDGGNTVGGAGIGEGNTIANNAGDGEFVRSNASGVSILGTSSHDNAGLGIHLASGANNTQAVPVLTAAISSATGTYISGTLASYPSTSFRIEFFSNQTPDPSGFGEGQTF